MKVNRRLFHKYAGLLACSAMFPGIGRAAANTIHAQISMLVGFSAGGPLDIAARRIAPGMSDRLAQPIIVENYAGAGGGIAVQRLLRSKPDGTTLFYGSPNEVVLAPYANHAITYRPEEAALAGVGAWTSLVLCAKAGLPANNIDELIALDAKSQTPLSFASVGIGSLQHLAGESIRAASGMKMLHVPYKGAAPGLNDLLGGQIDLAVLTLAGNTPALIQSGKIKSLGVLALQRDPAVPTLATINEGQRLRNIEFTIWGGLFAPAATPDAILSELNAVMRDVHADPRIATSIKDAGSNPPVVRSLAETKAFFASETAKYQKIAKSIDFSS